MFVVPEDGDIRRVDHGVAVALVSFPPVVGIHRRVLDRQVECAGATEVFFLGAGAGEESAPGVGGRGEIKRDHIVPFGLVTAMG